MISSLKNSFYGTLFSVFLIFFLSPFVFLFKFPDPYTTTKWIFTLLSLNFIIFLFLTKSKIIIFPQLPKTFFYVFGVMLAVILLNAYIHNVPLLFYDNMKRFVFWGAALYFFNLFCIEKEQAFLKIEKVICFTSAIFLILALTQYILHPEKHPFLTFGNINLAAEFVGFSLVFQLGALVRLWDKEKNSSFLNITTALSFSYIYFVQCRSIYIATAAVIFAVFYFNKNIWKSFVKLLILAISFILIIKGILYILHPQAVIFIEKVFSLRWLLYLNTLKMIMENPLGVGIGQFEFASIPYIGNLAPDIRETTLFLTPHDEFLHWLAEDGIILSLLFFILGSVLVPFFWKDIKRIFSSTPEFIYFSLVLFVQSLFQFPLMAPLPYIMIAMMLGYFFSSAQKAHLNYTLTRSLKYILLSANFLAFLVFALYFSARYIGFNFPSNEPLNKLACTYGCREWLPCLNVAFSQTLKGNYDTADTYALRVLEWQPLNYQAIRSLGFSSLYQGNVRKACKLFKQYDDLFENESSLHGIMLKECQGIP